jgi:hypothetical protein
MESRNRCQLRNLVINRLREVQTDDLVKLLLIIENQGVDLGVIRPAKVFERLRKVVKDCNK